MVEWGMVWQLVLVDFEGDGDLDFYVVIIVLVDE